MALNEYLHELSFYIRNMQNAYNTNSVDHPLIIFGQETAFNFWLRNSLASNIS
jgi:hypothetical protein